MKWNNLLNQSRSLTSCRLTWVVRPGTAFRGAPYTHSVADAESPNSFFAPDCCISQGGVTKTGSPAPVIECEGAFSYRREISRTYSPSARLNSLTSLTGGRARNGFFRHGSRMGRPVRPHQHSTSGSPRPASRMTLTELAAAARGVPVSAEVGG
jgi:hypothetical protein